MRFMEASAREDRRDAARPEQNRESNGTPAFRDFAKI
jgi:hypothetical protein